jgi:aspartyl-tRNA(Asn)/glutamyl-tRNA(Gln) amidotransferase subunit A
MEETQAGINEMVMEAVRELEKKGAKLVNVSMLDPKFSIADYTIIQRSGVSSNLARYDGVRYGHDRTYFGSEAKRRIMLGTYALSSGYYDAYYLRAQKVRTLIRQDFLNAFEHVDAIATPTAPTPAFRLGEKSSDPLQMYLMDIFTISCNLAGLCGISVPCGFTSGERPLPIGLQLLGKHFEEEKILTLAHTYEQGTDWHLRKPSL